MPPKKKASKKKRARNYLGPRETFCERAEDYCPRSTFEPTGLGSVSNVALGLFLLALISQPSTSDPRLTPGKLKPQKKAESQDRDQLTLPGTGAKP